MASELADTLSALDLLALTLYGEARGLNRAGRRAVGQVVMHRVTDARRRFGETVADVVLAPAQFSCWASVDGSANFAAVIQLAQDVVDGRATKDSVFGDCRWLAREILAGEGADLVAGATHYLTRELFERKPPSWAQGQTPVAEVGPHVFFKL